MSRIILHADINSCYAQIECLHNPELRGKPVAVGGDVEARHGIILAKNQEAKPYNIRVGEALWQARQKCPNLIIVPPHFDLYMRFSKLVRGILSDYSDQIEPFGLDESWIDITGSVGLFGDGKSVADKIRERTKSELGLTVSVGVSFNKVFAKLGSDYKKPDATTVFTQENYKEKVWTLPVGELLYVGPSTQRALQGMFIRTIGQLAQSSPRILQQRFGKWGKVLHCFANGLDSSPVKRLGEEAVVKSIGNSTTTPKDICGPEEAKIVYYNLSESVASRLREHGLKGRTIQISVRDTDLVTFERQLSLDKPTNISGEICSTAMLLLTQHYNWRRPLRSIGVRATNMIPENDYAQISFFVDESKRQKQEALDRTVDDIRRRFGHTAILRAVMHTDPQLS